MRLHVYLDNVGEVFFLMPDSPNDKHYKNGKKMKLLGSIDLLIELPVQSPIIKECPICGCNRYVYDNANNAVRLSCDNEECRFELSAHISQELKIIEIWNGE